MDLQFGRSLLILSLSVPVPVYFDTVRYWLLKNLVCTLWRSAQAVSTWQEIWLLTTYTTHPDLQHGLAVLTQGLEKLLAGLLKWQLYASILTDSQVLLLTSAEPAGIPTWSLQQKASSVHYLILWRTCKQNMKIQDLGCVGFDRMSLGEWFPVLWSSRFFFMLVVLRGMRTEFPSTL